MLTAPSAQEVAIATGSFLSGAMMSISLLAVPTCLDTFASDTQLARMWERIFHYGHRALPTLAVATCGLYITIGYRRRTKRWQMVLAGITTASMLPFTWILMFPTNDRLFAMVAESEAATNRAGVDFTQAKDLVMRWGRLHMTRSFLPLIGVVIGLMAKDGGIDVRRKSAE